MKTQGFPTCCGITLHTEFGNTRHAINKTKFTPEQVNDYLKRQDTPYNLGLDMIVLNHEQKEVLHRTMIKRGYKLTRRKGYYHPNHRSYLHIYIKENYPQNAA